MNEYGNLVQKENRSKDDILLTYEQVKKLKLIKISQWPSDRDVFSLKYGMHILIGTSIISGMTIWHRHRKLLKVATNGLISSLFVSVALPSTAAAFTINKYFTENLYIMSKNNINQCLLCREMNAIGLLVSISTLIPTISSWVVAYIFAHRFKTFGIPTYAYKDLQNRASRKIFYRDTYKIYLMSNKGIPTLLTKIIAGQIVFGSLFFYMQQKQYFEIEDKFIYTPKEIESVITDYDSEKYLNQKSTIQKIGETFTQFVSRIFKRD